MICDCQRNLFDCEEKVRLFLGKAGSLNLAARDELIARMTPLVERMVGSKLQGKWRQDRANVVQDTFLKLCDPAKLRTWLESPRRTWFCHWAVVVAYHCTIDWIRESSPPAGSLDAADRAAGPRTSLEVQEQATELRRAIISALAEFDREWQLVFYAKYAYLDPSISDIARACRISEETVFFRLRRMKESIARRCASLLSPEVSKVALVGTRHPLDGFERLDRASQRQANDRINRLLSSRPVPEQLAFYMKYSPLAPDIECIADRVGEKGDAVSLWLERIESEIRLPALSESA